MPDFKDLDELKNAIEGVGTEENKDSEQKKEETAGDKAPESDDLLGDILGDFEKGLDMKEEGNEDMEALLSGIAEDAKIEKGESLESEELSKLLGEESPAVQEAEVKEEISTPPEPDLEKQFDFESP